MVSFQNRAWKILALSEKIAGTWPFANGPVNRLLRITLGMLPVSVGIASFIRLVEEFNITLYIVIDNFTFLILVVCMFTRFSTSALTNNQRRKIFEQVASHLENIDDEEEAKILRDGSSDVLTFTIRYMAFLMFVTGSYVSLPQVKMFWFYFFGDGVKVKQLPLFVDYLIDEDKYFFYLLIHILLGLIAGSIIGFTFDYGFFLSVKHACELFNIVNIRVARASDIFEQCDENNKYSKSDESMAYKIISSAVDLHNEALELTKLIDRIYRRGWFIILLLNAVLIAPLPVMAMLFKDEPFELCRRSFILVMYLVHFYVVYLQGQMIIDHSSSVFDNCCDFYWYNASKRCRAALSMMKSRSLKPCELTGGNMFVLSMETYSQMLKTALSYISMFSALFF